MILVRQQPRDPTLAGRFAVFLRPADRVLIAGDLSGGRPAAMPPLGHHRQSGQQGRPAAHPLWRDATVCAWSPVLAGSRVGLLCSRDLVSNLANRAGHRLVLDLGLFVRARRRLNGRVPRSLRRFRLTGWVIAAFAAGPARVPLPGPHHGRRYWMSVAALFLGMTVLATTTGPGQAVEAGSPAAAGMPGQTQRGAGVASLQRETGSHALDDPGTAPPTRAVGDGNGAEVAYRRVPTAAIAPEVAPPAAQPQASDIATVRQPGLVLLGGNDVATACYRRLEDGTVLRAACGQQFELAGVTGIPGAPRGPSVPGGTP